MSFTGDADSAPMRYPIAIADMTSGIYAAMGILAALLARTKTGQGQFLDMALFDSQLTWLANAGSSYLNAGVAARALGECAPQHRSLRNVLVAVTMLISSLVSERKPLWRKFADVLDATKNLRADPAFKPMRCA